ncbi:lactococcin 972 family bacteriocin [Streptomyces sp. UH6]|uniref:lactococcin 972 family bacteriocin n=1 Tax=Streptomyces sp. UH6 TaxID=2748379 RepID=UPI0015D4DEEA|nr:lactococcin 972 family bacteriocin [Streptomyces sp. UH6]NYV72756.1 lactococcin 972 family bacteriocin [Streptomyces sp. UH6]
MKISGKIATFAAVLIMAAAGSVATSGSATAATPKLHTAHYTASSPVAPPASLRGPHGEKPVEWGVAVFSVDPAAKAFSATGADESAGGGTWTYGTELVASTQIKGCYSNYMHRTKKHSASVSMASQTDKDIQAADIWANARVNTGYGYTCYTYWGVY